MIFKRPILNAFDENVIVVAELSIKILNVFTAHKSLESDFLIYIF